MAAVTHVPTPYVEEVVPGVWIQQVVLPSGQAWVVSRWAAGCTVEYLSPSGQWRPIAVWYYLTEQEARYMISKWYTHPAEDWPEPDHVVGR